MSDIYKRNGQKREKVRKKRENRDLDGGLQCFSPKKKALSKEGNKVNKINTTLEYIYKTNKFIHIHTHKPHSIA